MEGKMNLNTKNDLKSVENFDSKYINDIMNAQLFNSTKKAYDEQMSSNM